MSYIVPLGIPKSCSDCHYAVLKYFHPYWHDGEGSGKKAYCCQADEDRKSIELDLYDNTTKAQWCPLKEVEE